MLNPLASEYIGGTNLNIDFVITNAGAACIAEITCYVYDGSISPQHGTLLKTYTQDVTFSINEQKTVTFPHITVQRGEVRRDVGLVIKVSGEIIYSNEWDDVFYVTATNGGKIFETIGMLIMMFVMMEVMSLMEEGI